jgi:hypothetical protein
MNRRADHRAGVTCRRAGVGRTGSSRSGSTVRLARARWRTSSSNFGVWSRRRFSASLGSGDSAREVHRQLGVTWRGLHLLLPRPVRVAEPVPQATDPLDDARAAAEDALEVLLRVLARREVEMLADLAVEFREVTVRVVRDARLVEHVLADCLQQRARRRDRALRVVLPTFGRPLAHAMDVSASKVASTSPTSASAGVVSRPSRASSSGRNAS